MCLPCWPWTDIYVEKRIVKKDEEQGVLAWDPNARSMVRVTGVKSVSIEHFIISFIHSFYSTPPLSFHSHGSQFRVKSILVYPSQFTLDVLANISKRLFLDRPPFASNPHPQQSTSHTSSASRYPNDQHNLFLAQSYHQRLAQKSISR